MKTVIWNNLDKNEQQTYLQRPTIANNTDIKAQVAGILRNIRQNGDAAVHQYIKRFDGVTLDSFIVQKYICLLL